VPNVSIHEEKGSKANLCLLRRNRSSTPSCSRLHADIVAPVQYKGRENGWINNKLRILGNFFLTLYLRKHYEWNYNVISEQGRHEDTESCSILRCGLLLP
jgi:hypothetical protein